MYPNNGTRSIAIALTHHVRSRNDASLLGGRRTQTSGACCPRCPVGGDPQTALDHGRYARRHLHGPKLAKTRESDKYNCIHISHAHTTPNVFRTNGTLVRNRVLSGTNKMSFFRIDSASTTRPSSWCSTRSLARQGERSVVARRFPSPWQYKNDNKTATRVDYCCVLLPPGLYHSCRRRQYSLPVETFALRSVVLFPAIMLSSDEENACVRAAVDGCAGRGVLVADELASVFVSVCVRRAHSKRRGFSMYSICRHV